MKKLMPIPKLYNFNSKVLKNFPKIFLLFILSLWITLQFYSEVEATVGVRKVIVDGTEYPIYYIGSYLGVNATPITETVDTGFLGLGIGCYHNGVKDSGVAPRVAYQSGVTDKFLNIYEGAIHPISNGGEEAKMLAKKGFCAPINLCSKSDDGEYIPSNPPVRSYEFFSRDTDYNIFSHKISLGPGLVDRFYRPPSGLADFFQSRPVSIQECNKYRANKAGGAWLTRLGVYNTCHEAYDELPEGDRGAANGHRICAEFVCKNADIASDFDNHMNNGSDFRYINGATTADVGSCPWLNQDIQCKFKSGNDPEFLTSCVYDTDPAKRGSCGEGTRQMPFSVRTIETDDLGLSGPLAAKRIFCGSNNKPVVCPMERTDYDQVFTTNLHISIKDGSGCVLGSEVSRRSCIISEDDDCVFGNPANGDNCFSDSTTREYTNQNGNEFNLFCNNRNRTIACNSSVTQYTTAFPGTTNPGGPFNHDPDNCQEFSPGMNDIADRPTQACDLDEEGQIFAVGINGEEPRLFDPAEHRRCIANQVRNRNPADAVRICTDEQAGQGGRLQQCNCDVAFNPDFNFWLCAINFDEENCSPVCILQDAPNAAPIEVRVQAPVNPLGVIKTISDFLFALAVLIFIINLLRASFMYVTSGGDEGKMKEAQSTITNTIFGMVFIVFIGALLRWVIGVTQRIVE